MKTIIFSSFLILMLIVLIPTVDAQSDLHKQVNQKMVQIDIESDGKVSVIHQITNSNEPRELEFIEGSVSNLKFVSELGRSEDVPIEKTADKVGILENQGELFITYDLDDALIMKDGIWTLDFRYLETTIFTLPDTVDLIFVNERPVMLDKKNAFKCHGCEMVLEFSTSEPRYLKKVNWEDQEFLVEFRTFEEIKNFEFNQPSKEISFDVNGDSKYVNVEIPLELLWEPYIVLYNDQKIQAYQDFNNGTHVMINFQTNSTGQVSIIGTTVVPEFPIIAPLAIGFLIIMLVPLVRKFSLH